MVIILLVLNMIIFLCTSFAVIMFNNNLKKINKSIDIYLDPKAYRRESEVKLISLLVNKYVEYEDKSLMDLDSLISDCFYSHKIGKFKVTGIETFATKGKRLLWVSIIAMVIFESTTAGLGQSLTGSITIIVSAGLGIMLAFFEMYIDISMGKKQLFHRIKNYLNNEYPQFKITQKEKEEVAVLLKKINQLENQLDQHEKIKIQESQQLETQNQKIEEDTLQEEDIIEILKCFDISRI